MTGAELFTLLKNFKRTIKAYRDYAEDSAVEPYIVFSSKTPNITYASGQPMFKTTTYEIILAQKELNTIALKSEFMTYLLNNKLDFYGANEEQNNDEARNYFDLVLNVDLTEGI